jgi:hypothetical protein
MWERLTLAGTITILLYILLQTGEQPPNTRFVMESSPDSPTQIIRYFIARR